MIINQAELCNYAAKKHGENGDSLLSSWLQESAKHHANILRKTNMALDRFDEDRYRLYGAM